MRSLSILYIILLSFSAIGQESTHTKEGFFFGTSVGLSQLSLDSEENESGNHLSLSFPNFKIGKMINPKMAILLYLPGNVYTFDVSDRERDRGFEAILPSVQYWVTDRAWIMGGLGIGMDAPAFYDIRDETERKFYFGYSSALGLGYEFAYLNNKTFDIQGRVHYGSVDVDDDTLNGTAFSVLLGFNLY